MKTTGLFGRKFMNLEFRETEVPSPGFNDVIVKIHACGVCGTDLNFLKQWDGDPMPLGHEIAGEVVETGKDVNTVKPGDTVVVEDCTLCGVCPQCKNGRPDLCRNLLGLDGQSGMGQYLRVRHNNLVKYDGMDYTTACLTEPLTVCLNAVLASEIPLGGSVAVLGCGPLGLMTAGVARLQGASFVVMTEFDTTTPIGRARAAAASKMDVDMVINTQQEDVEQVIRRRFPNGVDRVIVSAPPQSIHDALKIICYGGLITFYGLHFGGGNKIEIDINRMIFNKISLRPVFGEPALNFNRSLDLLKAGLIPTDALITHTFAPGDAQHILQAMVNSTEPVIKAVVLPQD
ncbi:MAG: alcohol dehydrogenase catalytic domain-containing protein [Kiritimatiellales bacterium]